MAVREDKEEELESPEEEKAEGEEQSSGTSTTGFLLASLGPRQCSNCQKHQDDVCYEPEVREDKELPDRKHRLMENGGVKVASGEGCCEFLSVRDKKKWSGKLPKKQDREHSIGMTIMRFMGKH